VGSVEPAPGERNWSTLDALVSETAERGIKPLVFLYGPSERAVRRDGRKCSGVGCTAIAPASLKTRKAYARSARAAVERDGPGGDVWEPSARDPDPTPTPSPTPFPPPLRAFRLRGVFWHSWREKGGDQICAWCCHAGLRNPDGSAKPAWDAFVKVASG